MKKWRRSAYCIVAAGAVVLVLALNAHALLSAAGRWLDVGEKPQPADAVILLNGGYNTRPFVAAALVRGGWAPKVLLGTVALHENEADGTVPRAHEIAMSVLENGGVAQTEVALLDVSARTTYDEAVAVDGYLAAHPAKRLLLVTEGPHTRRSKWIFERVLASQHPEITVVSAPTEGFDYSLWWRSKDGFLFIISEYFKLFFYALCYGWLGYEIAIVLALAAVLWTWFRRRRKPVS